MFARLFGPSHNDRLGKPITAPAEKRAAAAKLFETTRGQDLVAVITCAREAPASRPWRAGDRGSALEAVRVETIGDDDENNIGRSCSGPDRRSDRCTHAAFVIRTGIASEAQF
jgi:hypothetical protein